MSVKKGWATCAPAVPWPADFSRLSSPAAASTSSPRAIAHRAASLLVRAFLTVAPCRKLAEKVLLEGTTGRGFDAAANAAQQAWRKSKGSTRPMHEEDDLFQHCSIANLSW